MSASTGGGRSPTSSVETCRRVSGPGLEGELADTVRAQSAWKRFWNEGRWWKALILVVAYLVLYNLASLLLLPFASDADDPKSAIYVLLSYVIPILFGGLILVAFGASVGWLRDLRAPADYGAWVDVDRHRHRGRARDHILRFATVDNGEAGIEYVMTWLLAGLFIGFAEELITRGYAVRIMRKAGHPEIAVALVSAVLFAPMHATNLISGQAIVPTLLQIVYRLGNFAVILAGLVLVLHPWPRRHEPRLDPVACWERSDSCNGAGSHTTFALCR